MVTVNREVAQAGSAPGLGPGGRRFESCLPDQSKQSLFDYVKKAFLFAKAFQACLFKDEQTKKQRSEALLALVPPL